MLPCVAEDNESMEYRSAKGGAPLAVRSSVKSSTRNSEQADIEVVDLASVSDTKRPRVPDSGSFKSLKRLHSSLVKSSPILLTASRTADHSNFRKQQQRSSFLNNIEPMGSLVDEASSRYEDSWLDDLPSPSLLLSRGQVEQHAPHYDLAESASLPDEAIDHNPDVLPEGEEPLSNSQEKQWLDAPGSPTARSIKPWKSPKHHAAANKAERHSFPASSLPCSTSPRCPSDETSYEDHYDHDMIAIDSRQHLDRVLGRGHLPAKDAGIEHLSPPAREALGTLSSNEEQETWVDSAPAKRRKVENSGSHEEDDFGAVDASKPETQQPHGLQLPWDDLTGLDLEFLAEIADIVEFV